jgi:hypothetical protein
MSNKFYQCCVEPGTSGGDAEAFGPRFDEKNEAISYAMSPVREPQLVPDDGYISVCRYRDHDGLAEWQAEVWRNDADDE